MRKAIALVACSFVVHAAVSCASAVADRTEGHDAGTFADAVAETIADAVRETFGGDDAKPAEAAPDAPAFTVDEVPCTTEKNWAGTRATFAEKAYAGRSKEELARVSVLVCGGTPTVEGYECHRDRGGVVFVRDGSIAVMCSAPAVARFVVPTL